MQKTILVIYRKLLEQEHLSREGCRAESVKIAVLTEVNESQRKLVEKRIFMFVNRLIC